MSVKTVILTTVVEYDDAEDYDLDKFYDDMYAELSSSDDYDLIEMTVTEDSDE